MSDEAVSHEPDRKSGGRFKRVAWMTGRVLVALASAAALASAGLARDTVQTVRENVPTSDVFTEEVERTAPPQDDGADDYLVVGSDTRTDAKGNPLPERVLRQLRTEASEGLNTDTVILLRIPKDGSKGYAISIPRDTYVTIPGYQDDKINAAYGVIKSRTAHKLRGEGKTDRAEIERLSDTAGRSALTQVVQELTGVRVDHYAEVNLYGFYLLTEAIGGVRVCLNQATSDPNSGASFRKGVQKISGGSALAFVRQRDGLPRGDLDRIVRQQAFLGSVMQQLLSAGTLTDQTKLRALTDAASKSVVVSPGLDILQLAKHLGSMSSGAVEFVTIPVTAVGARNDRGQSIITVDLPKVREYVNGLLGRQAPPKFAAQRPLRLNGAAVSIDSGQPATIDGVRCVD